MGNSAIPFKPQDFSLRRTYYGQQRKEDFGYFHDQDVAGTRGIWGPEKDLGHYLRASDATKKTVSDVEWVRFKIMKQCHQRSEHLPGIRGYGGHTPGRSIPCQDDFFH